MVALVTGEKHLDMDRKTELEVLFVETSVKEALERKALERKALEREALEREALEREALEKEAEVKSEGVCVVTTQRKSSQGRQSST